ncbi:sigma-E factor negative regulatory protein [Azoarcus sp. KH32C]|uniref:sigma-E factor negative regulatory protein n=1 Tax=Azoarcus sp. KH32C TaxID=748247 RepID=UPI00023862BD|nr:sigma-E factor negative regulatory protein [Azoarcus sp. KH32C]BAL25145.1 anti sigma-E protein [Azoarcus sp. KH32C]
MKDKLSAFLDGELDDQCVRTVLEEVRCEPILRNEWETYCLIGDALRGDECVAHDFVDRVMAEIDTAPTLLAPVMKRAESGTSGVWRSLMPLAASVMGVAAVGWVAHALYAEPTGVSHVAEVSPRLQLVESQVSGVRPVSVTSSAIDPHQEYVFAHQSMTGGGPISGAIQHVRSISEVSQDGAR